VNPRVLLTISSGRIGGAEVHVLWLATRLRAAGVAAEVACREGDLAARLRAEEVPVHVLGFGDGIDLGTPLRLARLASGFDLMHAHMNRASLYTRVAAALSGTPWVTTAHGMTKGVYYRGAHRVIAVSDAVRRHLEAQGVGPLTVIPNGLPEPGEASEADRERVREALGKGEPGRVVLVVLANLHRNKGQDLLVEALAELPETFHALLAGAGDFPELERRLRDDPALAARVHRVGILESAAAPYEVADALVVPSIREAFSLVAAEARMRGVPCVVSDVDGLVEVVPDDAPGCRRVAGRDPATWAAALREVGQASEAWRAHARAGATAARERFALGSCVAATRAVYGAVLAGASGP
jgi:glycosyltransferase involved in cell wall biosynthesis